MIQDTPAVPDVYSAEPIPGVAQDEINALLHSGDLFRYTSGLNSPVARLEKEFAELLDMPHALAVSSCSAALFLAIKALDLPRGSRIIMPAFTFAAVPSAVVHADCTPVLVECGHDYRIDPEDFSRKIDTNIAAVLISHMRGHTSDMDVILESCEQRGIPVIEDAAHSLGTRWHGRAIGTFGAIGCFSFQSYKMLNAGEGGILVTADPDLMARAAIMSGAYETNWKKHPGIGDRGGHWQNRLPLYNMRMNNLAAAVLRPQLIELGGRIAAGRRNHDHVAGQLNRSPWLNVPEPLQGEERAPDSIQFNLSGFATDDEARTFVKLAAMNGVDVQVFGLAEGNARAFWNWQFIDRQESLERTRAMLMRACDVRLPVHLLRHQLDQIAQAIVDAAETVRGKDRRSQGTSTRGYATIAEMTPGP